MAGTEGTMTFAIESTKELIDAAQAIVNCRDMCGNEAQALKDWQADNRKLTPDETVLVLERANRLWRMSQIAAGVPSKFWRY